MTDTRKFTPETPIERNISAGMSPIIAFLSEATCGEACWEAREDVCRCSCGGKNHGCMRTADGTRPTRTAKIDGLRYELKAVGRDLYKEATAINRAAPERKSYDGRYSYSWNENEKGAPARLKRATKDQVAKWLELSAAREEIDRIKSDPQHCYMDIDKVWPYLLWVKL